MLRLTFVGLSSLVLLGGCATFGSPHMMHDQAMHDRMHPETGAQAPPSCPGADGDAASGADAVHDQTMAAPGGGAMGAGGHMMQSGGEGPTCPEAPQAPPPPDPASDPHQH